MKKLVFIAGICIALIAIAYFQFRGSNAYADPRGSSYAGSAACAKCHGNLYNSYLHTAHYVASLPANSETVHGSFADGDNIFTVNGRQKVVMEKSGGKLFQTYYLDGKVKEKFPFDIVFGAVKGESYLYWQGNELYQTPLSYFTAQHQWSTSPGFGFNFLDYPRTRSIAKTCMECHSSYIGNLPGEAQQMARREQFDKASLVFSVDCERCHGPGAQHVDFQTSHPQVKAAKYITGYQSLSRQQRLDICAVCHSGMPTVMLRSSFEFIPGDTFAKFKLPELSRPVDTAHLDVHGNQLQLLQSSKCFAMSKLDCATCHHTHQDTRGNDLLFTQKCLSCHNNPGQAFCRLSDKLSASVLKTNCISCHMPALPTKVISVQVSDKQPRIQFYVHTHHIAIYPKETEKILAFISHKN